MTTGCIMKYKQAKYETIYLSVVGRIATTFICSPIQGEGLEFCIIPEVLRKSCRFVFTPKLGKNGQHYYVRSKSSGLPKSSSCRAGLLSVPCWKKVPTFPLTINIQIHINVHQMYNCGWLQTQSANNKNL